MYIKNKKTLILVISMVVVVVSIITLIIYKNTIKLTLNNLIVNIENNGKPKFIFNTTEFPDWATAGNVFINNSEITDDFQDKKNELPVSSINITQCKNGSNCNKLIKKCLLRRDDKAECKTLAEYTTNTPCFVTAHYNKQKIDVKIAKEDELKQWAKFGTNPTALGVSSLTMNTPYGDKNYQFYKYDTNNNDVTYKRGSAFGFISLDDGHVEVRSVCQNSSQLDITLPVLSAISID